MNTDKMTEGDWRAHLERTLHHEFPLSPRSDESIKAARTTMLEAADKGAAAQLEEARACGAKMETMHMTGEFVFDKEAQVWRLERMTFEETVTLPEPLHVVSLKLSPVGGQDAG